MEIGFTQQIQIIQIIQAIPVITQATTPDIAIGTARAAAARSAALVQASVRAVRGAVVARRAVATSARPRCCC